MSYKAEVQVVNEPGQWYSNGLAFATQEEAEAYGKDLMSRWPLVTDVRATETDWVINYKWEHGEAIRLEEVTP